MSEPTKLTPTPWRLEANGLCFNLRSPDRVDPFAILVGMVHNNSGEFEANAAHIVRCVNQHYGLVAACEAVKDDVQKLRDYLDGPGVSTGQLDDKLMQTDRTISLVEQRIESALAENAEATT